MDNPVFDEEAVAILHGCVFDPAANYGCELVSGAVHWSDERFFDLVSAARDRGLAAKCLFAYRTSLLVGRLRPELQFAWDAARNACPEWVGFRPERTTPAAHWPGFVEAALDSY